MGSGSRPPKSGGGIRRLGALAAQAVLTLIFSFTAQAEPKERILFLLDASGSMVEGNRFVRAQSTILSGVDSMEHSGGEVGLIVFGGGDCGSIDFKAKPGPDAPKKIRQYLQNFHPYGSTPIAGALKMVREFLKEHPEPKPRLVILTDGLDNCSGDEVALMKELKAKGLVESIDYQWLAPPHEWPENDGPIVHPSSVPRELVFGGRPASGPAPKPKQAPESPQSKTPAAVPSVAPSAPPVRPSPQPSKAPPQVKPSPKPSPSEPPELESPLL